MDTTIHDTTDDAPSESALDAYSRTVIEVAESLTASVAPDRGGASGGGRARLTTPAAYPLRRAPGGGGRPGGAASLPGGRGLGFAVVGAARLSDLAVLRADASDLIGRARV